VKKQDVYEIKSPLLFSTQPTVLPNDLAELQNIIERWRIKTGQTSSIGTKIEIRILPIAAFRLLS
jgi:hypothetical protein